MIQALVISNDTVKRMGVIKYRTGCDFISTTKAMMIAELKRRMKNEVVHFAFMKKDGSLREAFGTVKPTLVRKHTNGWGDSRERYFTTAFFDVEVGGWRSFRWESIVWVE